VAFKTPGERHDYFPSHHATFYNGKGSQVVDREFLRLTSHGPGAKSPLVGSRDKALVGGLGDEVPQKQKQNGN